MPPGAEEGPVRKVQDGFQAQHRTFSGLRRRLPGDGQMQWRTAHRSCYGDEGVAERKTAKGVATPSLAEGAADEVALRQQLRDRVETWRFGIIQWSDARREKAEGTAVKYKVAGISGANRRGSEKAGTNDIKNIRLLNRKVQNRLNPSLKKYSGELACSRRIRAPVLRLRRGAWQHRKLLPIEASATLDCDLLTNKIQG